MVHFSAQIWVGRSGKFKIRKFGRSVYPLPLIKFTPPGSCSIVQSHGAVICIVPCLEEEPREELVVGGWRLGRAG